MPLKAASQSNTQSSQPRDSQQAAADLKFLRDKLRRFETELQQKQSKRDRQQLELISVEKDIASLNDKQRQTEEELEQVLKQREALQQRHYASAETLEMQKTAVRQWARSGYALGKQSFLKVLLTQAEPDTLVRTVTYYGYLAKAQNVRISSLTKSLAGLTKLDDALQQTTRELSQLRDVQFDFSRKLQAKRNERGRVVASLNQDIRNNEAALIGLRADEQQLLRLLETVAITRTEPRPRPSGVPFNKLKGKLNLPAKARIVARFGEDRPFGDTSWDGLLLQAPTGTNFHAIADGEVVFSDWFRGYGLLLILDHGEGFMSVYSHGETLTRSLGERVAAGEVIGKVGITGGLSTPGLYFAIRRNGKPEDPLAWVKPG